NAAYRPPELSACAQVAETVRALDHDAPALDAQARARSAARDAQRLAPVQAEAGTAGYLQVLLADQQSRQARHAWGQ
ncbi:RND transporter, partial [Burkholderia pseudomallei]